MRYKQFLGIKIYKSKEHLDSEVIKINIYLLFMGGGGFGAGGINNKNIINFKNTFWPT